MFFDPALIRAEAAKQNLDLSHVAERSGLSYQVVLDAAKGRRDPKVGTLSRIADALGVPVTAFFASSLSPKVEIGAQDAVA